MLKIFATIGTEKNFKAQMIMHNKPGIVHLPNKFGVTYKDETSKNGKIKHHFLKYYDVSPQAKMIELSTDMSGEIIEGVQIINGKKEEVNYTNNIYEEDEIGDSLGNLVHFIVGISKKLGANKS